MVHSRVTHTHVLRKAFTYISTHAHGNFRAASPPVPAADDDDGDNDDDDDDDDVASMNV